MKQTVHPAKVSGNLFAPPSKSHAQRAIILSSLARGRSVISNPGDNDDVRAAIEIGRAFGALVVRAGNKLEICGCQIPASTVYNCRESGFLSRAFTPVLASFPNSFEVTGKGSLLKRDQLILIESLAAFGVHCQGHDGMLPIKIKGPFEKFSASINGAQGSQVLSGLLMAAPLTNQPVNLWVNDLKSKKYVDLTIDIMRHFGVNVEQNDYEHFFVHGNQEYLAASINIEGDWSAASFLLVAGAVAGNVNIANLNPDSYQPDKAIVDLLQMVGADIEISGDKISASKNKLKPFRFDATNCPDLFPPLVALAANCNGTSTIKGVGRLANKESDRATALIDVFESMGVEITAAGNEMVIMGGGKIRGCEVHSHNDHRIAMAAAVAALNASGPITISGSEAVAKSYPEFFEHLVALGTGHIA